VKPGSKQNAVSSKKKDHVRLFGCLCLLLAAILPTAVSEAQQRAKIPRIGFLSLAPSSPSVQAFQQGLRDLGYVERKNILVEYRYVEGRLDRYPSLAAEFVQLKVDVLVATAGFTAVKQATKTIPIVMVITGDPVALGFVESLAHPGGNITGLTRLTRDLSGKRLELLKEVVPTISRVGVLWDANVTTPGVAFKEYERAAPTLKVQLQSLKVRGPNPDLEGALEAAAKGRANALVTILNPLLNRYQKQIADLAIKNRMPSMFEASDYVDAGGLMSYSTNDAECFKRAAYYVDRILKGAKPADLPIEQPTKFDLGINLKTAKQLNIIIPSHVLLRADRVIR
jgi:putative ABC transport system substrate-binding protein